VPQWCRFNNIPCVLFSHERASDVVADRFATWLPVASIFDRWAQNIQDNVNAVVCASKYAAQEYRHMSERVRIIHLGVDHKTFTSSAAIQKQSSSPVVLYAGRLSIEKRPYVAIAAIRELQIKGQRIKLLIAGDGAMRKKLEATAEGLDVTFLGRISDRNQLAEIMASVDVVIAPSPYETFGLTILESLACGTPVVVSNNGAGQELIENGCGEAVESSGTEVAEALLRIMSEDRDSVRRRCISRASGYSWHLAASEMLQLFESLTSIDVVKAA
jgi:alpha-1,6-mannosyltransferase